MTTEVHGLAAFYASGGGQLAARLVRERLRRLWPDLSGQSLLGIGHVAPYLAPWRGQARACIALTPSQGALVPCPGALLAEEDALPFADASFDRVLLVHGLDAADNARRLLREVWRVLRDDGRVAIVVPNRMGLWAQTEHTPFGQGQPYSQGQLTRLLARHLFRVERRDAALFLPPYGFHWLRAAAPVSEPLGRLLFPGFSGLVILEARKDLFAGQPAGTVALRRRIVMEHA